MKWLIRKPKHWVWPVSSFDVWTVTSLTFSSRVKTSVSLPMSLILWMLLPSQLRRPPMNCDGTKILAWSPGNIHYKNTVSTDQALSDKEPAKLQTRPQPMKSLTAALGYVLRSAFQTLPRFCPSLKYISELNLKASPITQCSLTTKLSSDSITCKTKLGQDHTRTL